MLFEGKKLSSSNPNTPTTPSTTSLFGGKSSLSSNTLAQAANRNAIDERKSKIDTLNKTLENGNVDTIYKALRDAKTEGTISKEDQVSILDNINKIISEQGASNLKDIYSLGSFAGEFGNTAVNFGKGAVSGLQQGAGAVADTTLQAVISIKDLMRNLDFGTTEARKNLDRMIDVNSSESLRKLLQQQKDISGENILGTSSVDTAANNIRIGKGTADDYAKVGLMGLNVGASAMTFANPIAGFTKTLGGTMAKNAFNNAVVGAIGGGAGAGVNNQDILGGALQGAVAGAALSGAGDIIGKARGGVKLSQTVSKSGLTNKIATISKNISDTELGKALNAAKDKVGTLIDKNQYVYSALKGVKDGKQTANEVVRGLTTDVKQAAGVAKAIREESGQLSNIGKLIKEQSTATGKTIKEVSKDLTDFISAKQTAINKAKVDGTAANVVTGTPAQERAYELLNQATKPFVKRAFDSGLIDEATFNRYMADSNYTRVQRELEDTISIGNKGGGDTSVSSTTFGQKLTGSNKKALNPIDSFVDWSNKIETEIAKNTKAKYVTDKLFEAGKAKQLVNASDVAARKALYGEANQTRVLVKELDKTLKSQSKYIKNIKSEIDNIKGSGKVAVTNELKKTLKEIFPTNKEGVIDLKAAAEKIKNIDSAEIRSLKKQLGARDSKLIKALDDIQVIKEQHLQASKDLQDVISQAKALSDDSTTGKFTLSRFTNGIKEVFETDPNIVKSVKNMDKAYLGATGKFISYPSKVLQRGATALNAAFPLPNFIKDQVSSFILSKHGLSTHNPISFWQGLKEGALKPSVNAAARGLKLAEKNVDIWKPSKLFSDWSNKNAGITLVELSRDAKSVARQAAEEMGLKGPSLMRKAESVVSATENMTRYQNFFGEYQDAIKKGSSTDEAFKLANQAARENSVDFSQVGELNEFGKILNPYMNASIQGSRSLVRALKERPVATGIKIAATVLAPVAASTYYNMADPRRALIYTQIPDYEKESNLIFVMSNGSYLKFPLPIGVKEFANPLRNLITSEYVGDRDGFLETANNLMVKPFNPFNLGDIIPVPIKPLVENMANYSFFTGEPIVGKNLKDLPANEQTYKSTSQLYKDIGGVLGVSPLQVKNTIKGYGAGGAEQIVSAIDKARGLTNKNVTSENRDTISQIVKRFYGEKPSETGNAVVDRFYKEYTPLSAQSSSTSKKITALLKKKKDSEAKKLANDFNKKVEAANTKYKTTYGTYMKDSALLDTLNNLKIDLTPESISRRKKQD